MPVSDKVIVLHMETAIPITIIVAYAPTAEGQDYEKNIFYQQVNTYTKKYAEKGIVYVMGDFNARIQTKQDDSESPIGPHTFDANRNKLDGQSEGAAENRSKFLAYCLNNKLNIANTFFQKSDLKVLTYAEPGVHGQPYTRGRYETLDYILVTNRWKNTVLDCESHLEAGINTRHAPLWAKIRIKLKRYYERTPQQTNQDMNNAKNKNGLNTTTQPKIICKGSGTMNK